MISEYIDLIESFKKNQISKLIEKINLKIFEALSSPKFNPKIAPYFQSVNKEGVPFTDYSLDPDNISQIKKIINALYYARLTFIDLENVDLRDLNRSAADLKLLYSKTIHQAYQASYLLTHLDVDIKEMFSDELALILPYFNKFKTIAQKQSVIAEKLKDYPLSYKAFYLLSHLQTDIKETFDEGSSATPPTPTKLKTTAEKQSDQSMEFAEKLKDFPLAYKTGEVTGIAIEQMQPNSGDLDYNFLTQFSAELPGYIDKITKYISQYSSPLIEKESQLNKEKIAELQDAAFKLLNDLESLKGNSLFLSFKVINYIHIIRNIITLSLSALEQMGHLSDSSQELICDKLAKLKYSVLPTLFGLVDKIEDNAMLKPGTLSIPLMNKIKPLYDLLIFYASKPVDFEQKGEALLSIEDSRFLALRLERTYKRIDTANKALFKIKKAQEALADFYLILDVPKYKNTEIHKLPQDIRDQLIEHYKMIKPYMMQIDPDFNELIINSLLGKENWTSYLSKPLHWLKEKLPGNAVSPEPSSLFSKAMRWVKGQLPINHASFVIQQKATLEALISKNINTQEFHIALNKDLISSVQEQTNLVLFPYSEQVSVFTIDESAAFISPEDPTSSIKFKQINEHKVVAAPEQLTADQALDLYQWYRNKHNKFMSAKNAYIEFIVLINSHAATMGDVLHIDKLNEGVKAKCRNLYNLFQPYFISGIPPALKAAALNLDNYLVHSLSNKDKLPKVPPLNLFAKMDEHFQVYFSQIDLKWNEESRKYLRIAKEKLGQENGKSKLQPETNAENRAHHLIPHTKYSRFVKEFRTTLFQITGLFNNSMLAELTPKPSGVPFPELENSNQTLAQSKQVLAVKRIFNGLFHIEGIVLELESLTNRQYESKYVYHLLLAYAHINDIIKLSQELATDPHFELIGRQLLEKAQTIYATIQEHSDAYQVNPDEVSTHETVQYNGLWYTLNAFFIIPKHIRAINNSNYLTNKELNELHLDAKNSAIRIEKIINSSNSYFKLFLQTPNMYRLYRDLSSKLNEFVSTAHNTMVDNLDKLRAEFITPMLLEADTWEDKLGLKPGTLSAPLKDITDEYYKGLLHPLGLHSKTHIALVCDKDPIDKRIEITGKKSESAAQHVTKLEKNYRHVEKLYAQLQKYEHFSNGFLPPKEPLLETIRSELIIAYQKALPKLVKLQKNIPLQPGKNPEDYKYDSLFNSGVKQYDPKLSQTEALITASHHYYLGLRSTYQMQLNTAKEKLAYLTEVRATQEKADLVFIVEYTTESFNKQLEALCNRHIGLQYTDKEYRKKLKIFLLTFKEEIISQAKTADDINLTIKNLLKGKISLFEKEQFAQHYHLDTVRVALAQFKNYFSLSNSAIENNNSIFENEQTLKNKTENINRLIDIAENEQLSIDERFNLIQFNVQNPNFERIILASRQENYFSFTYLKQCFLYLLEILYLYTPERKTLYKSLNQAVYNKPKIDELTKRFGLFASDSTHIEEPVKKDTPTESNLNEAESIDKASEQTLAKKWPTEGRENMLMFIQQMNKKPGAASASQPTRESNTNLISVC